MTISTLKETDMAQSPPPTLDAEFFHQLEEHGMRDPDLDHLRAFGLTRLSRLSDQGFQILTRRLHLNAMRGH